MSLQYQLSFRQKIHQFLLGRPRSDKGKGKKNLFQFHLYLRLKIKKLSNESQKLSHDLFQLLLEKCMASISQNKPAAKPQKLHPVWIDCDSHFSSG
jgi:hypothetical protein